MSDTTGGDHPLWNRNGAVALLLIAVAIAGTVALLYGPVLPLAMTGDSYQWIQHAHMAAHRPALLLADLSTFYRPSTTWTLVADRLVWGGFDSRGYRTSSLILHGMVAVLLGAAGRRLGLGWFAAAAVSLVWVTAPFTDESALIVAYRFQPLLLISWLVLIAVWPRTGDSWSRGSLIIAALALVSAAAAKETWVVTPALVAALEFERRRSLRSTLIATAVAASAVLLYLMWYFTAFPGGKTYFEFGPHIAARFPCQLAAFLYLEEPAVVGLSLSWKGVVAVVLVAAIVITCLKWRVPGTLVALGLLVLPVLPTILVSFMPQRYLAIPYAGFLLLTALWISAISARKVAWRTGIRGAAILTTVLLTILGAVIVRADQEDFRVLASAHAVLLEEAVDVAPLVAAGDPIGVVRDEQRNPSFELVDSPVGYPKLVFIRNHDPYGLIDAAALFEWVLADEGFWIQRIDEWPTSFAGVGGVVLIHRNGGFVNDGISPDLAGEMTRWKSQHRAVQVIRATPILRRR